LNSMNQGQQLRVPLSWPWCKIATCGHHTETWVDIGWTTQTLSHQNIKNATAYLWLKYSNSDGLFVWCIEPLIQGTRTNNCLWRRFGKERLSWALTDQFKTRLQPTPLSLPYRKRQLQWKDFGNSFGKLSLGQKIQTSKYTNDLLPTAHWIQTLDNQTNGQCFACKLLWETMTHVLTCSCEARGPA
jgi:hypothetical protein